MGLGKSIINPNKSLPVKIRVLWHFPLSICMGNVDAAPLHLLIEPVLGVTGWTLQSSLAGLQSRLLHAVTMESSATARRYQPSWSWPRWRRYEGIIKADLYRGVLSGGITNTWQTDHTGRVLHHMWCLGLFGCVSVAKAVHIVPEDEEMFSRWSTQSTTGKVIILFTRLPATKLR